MGSRSFAEIAEEFDLVRLGVQDVGVTYFSRVRPGRAGVVVRQFTDPESQARVYANLVASVARWVAERTEVARMVQVEPALEVGRDFYARRDHPYLPSLYAYGPESHCADEIRLTPPPALQEMRTLLDARLPPLGARSVVERVLWRSLMAPAFGTFVCESSDGLSTFLVSDPAMTEQDVALGASADGSSS